MSSAILFMTAVPIFYFLFVLAYKPFGMEEFLAVGQERYSLYLIVTSLIVLGVMAGSRILLFMLRRVIDQNWALYILWCFGEVIATGLFISIPMGIGWASVQPYFTTMSLCVLYSAGIMVFPLSIITMAIQLFVLNRQAEGIPTADEKSLIRFYDETKRLKLILAADSILYLESDENYVKIAHLDGGKIKVFNLRSSMRALEENVSAHGLVRCHRSYFINSAHVVMLKKDINGYALAQLDQDGLKPIPVSKRYYDVLAKLL